MLVQVNFSRSPYPIFGLTASAGSPVRSESIEVRADKIARLRMDLELVYNSAAGRSTDDNVDSHGSLHGTVRGGLEDDGGGRRGGGGGVDFLLAEWYYVCFPSSLFFYFFETTTAC